MPPLIPKQTVRTLINSPLAQALTWPHGVDRYLELLDPLLAAGETRARMVAVHRETADCCTLVLKPNARWAGFEPGQHVQVGVELDGVRRTRCFSVSSSAKRADGFITLTVKAQADGFVSRHLIEAARMGDVISLSAASGEFVLPKARSDRLLLISGGSGITPVMSMLRSLLDEQYAGEIVFLHYARTRADAIFADELTAIAQAHANVRVVTSYTREKGPKNSEWSGHFSAQHPQGLCADYAQWPTFACGPAPLIESVQAHWKEVGAEGNLKVEYFQPPVRQNKASGGEVRFAHSERLAIDNGATLLEQAEAAGLNPEYGCRMGICHTCTCKKTAGQVRNLLTGELSENGEQDIQPCISVPVGDVTLNL